MKFAEKIDIGHAFVNWIDTLYPIASNHSKDLSAAEMKRYKSASKSLKEILRRYGYSKNAVETIIYYLRSDVNLED